MKQNQNLIMNAGDEPSVQGKAREKCKRIHLRTCGGEHAGAGRRQGQKNIRKQQLLQQQ
jgi:ribosomal protein L19E